MILLRDIKNLYDQHVSYMCLSVSGCLELTVCANRNILIALIY